jgi:hypothetical protein
VLATNVNGFDVTFDCMPNLSGDRAAAYATLESSNTSAASVNTYEADTTGLGATPRNCFPMTSAASVECGNGYRRPTAIDDA